MFLMGDDAQPMVEQLLKELEADRREALDELLPYVYGELSEIAHGIRQRWQGDHTLNTTALIHEAYLKLVNQSRIGAASRAHFLALAAKAMRHILVNYARDRRALKRGGGTEALPLDEQRLTPGEVGLSATQMEQLMALDEALGRLESVDTRQCRVVECRFFGGMTVAETAAALAISERTVKREWAVAQAWLQREMEGGRV